MRRWDLSGSFFLLERDTIKKSLARSIYRFKLCVHTSHNLYYYAQEDSVIKVNFNDDGTKLEITSA